MARNSVLWLALAALIVLTGPASAQDVDTSPPSEPKPPEATEAPPEPDLPGDAQTVPWSDDEVAAAKAACTEMLAGMTLDYEPLPPIKDGLCGAPAPILVRSIGSDPTVAIEPPATMTCKLAVTLNKWLATKVQPAARVELDSPVVTIRNASSYVCRNRYGGADTLISQHALANALDVAEFTLASGDRVTVLDNWPHVAAAASTSPKDSVGEEPVVIPVKHAIQPARLDPAHAPTKPLSNPFVASPSPKTNPFVAPVSAPQTALPMAPPEAKPPAPPADPSPGPSAIFVKQMHAAACKMFGTVLGPEANEAHKDHFHLDMKTRRHSAYCE